MADKNENDGTSNAVPHPDGDEKVLHERYPSRRLLDMIANRWTPIVTFCLSSGTRHYGEMQRQIPDISKKMLSQVLRRLEADGVVHRTVYRAVPPKTDYQLTSLGLKRHEPVALLCEWAEKNTETLDAIDANRTERENWIPNLRRHVVF